jgi:WD40 repeat protein
MRVPRYQHRMSENMCLAFSPTGRFLCAGYDDGTVIVWDKNYYRQVISGKLDSAIKALLWHDQPDVIATASCDGHIALLRTDTWGISDIRCDLPHTHVALDLNYRRKKSTSSDRLHPDLWIFSYHLKLGDGGQMRLAKASDAT